MPPRASLLDHPDILCAFHRLSFQARNQAKAAIKNKSPIANNGVTVQWILLIGPYWVSETFGLFTKAELSVRAFKESGVDADWDELVLERKRVEAALI